MRLVLLLKLGQIHLWIVLSQVLHSCLLLLSLQLLLFALFEGLLLVDLELLVFDFFRREFVVWDVDEVELVFLAFLLDQTKLELDRMDFFKKFVMWMMLPE